MYTPHFNAEDDIPTLQSFIQANPLCTLVVPTQGGMVATHIPMVLHTESSAIGILRGHVARANPIWKDFDVSEDALGIFTSPQHYISASWYPGKADHGKEIPTWNYVAVHVYGRLSIIEKPSWLLQHLHSLTNQSEVIAEKPWNVADAPADFIAKLSKGIVGLELPVSRFVGKWKVSQNRSKPDAAAVVQNLQKLGTAASNAMSELIETRRPR